MFGVSVVVFYCGLECAKHRFSVILNLNNAGKLITTSARYGPLVFRTHTDFVFKIGKNDWRRDLNVLRKVDNNTRSSRLSTTKKKKNRNWQSTVTIKEHIRRSPDKVNRVAIIFNSEKLFVKNTTKYLWIDPLTIFAIKKKTLFMIYFRAENSDPFTFKNCRSVFGII